MQRNERGIILAIYAGLLHPAATYTYVIKAIKGRDHSLHN